MSPANWHVGQTSGPVGGQIARRTAAEGSSGRVTEPGDSAEGNRGAAPAPKRRRIWWAVAVGAAAILAALIGVQQWRVRTERAAILKERVETEARLRRLKEEWEAAKVEEERLKRQLDQVRKKADEAAKERRSPPYFDSPGWRNDTGKPSRRRVRPLPVDPSQRRPEERDPVP